MAADKAGPGALAGLALHLLATPAAGSTPPDTAGWVAHAPAAGGYRLLAPADWRRARVPRSGIHAVVLHAPEAGPLGAATCTVRRRDTPALAGLSAEDAEARELDDAALRAAVGELGTHGEMRRLPSLDVHGRRARHLAFTSSVTAAAATLAFRGEALVFQTPGWAFVAACRTSASDAAGAEAAFRGWAPTFKVMLGSLTFE